MKPLRTFSFKSGLSFLGGPFPCPKCLRGYLLWFPIAHFKDEQHRRRFIHYTDLYRCSRAFLLDAPCRYETLRLSLLSRILAVVWQVRRKLATILEVMSRFLFDRMEEDDIAWWKNHLQLWRLRHLRLRCLIGRHKWTGIDNDFQWCELCPTDKNPDGTLEPATLGKA